MSKLDVLVKSYQPPVVDHGVVTDELVANFWPEKAVAMATLTYRQAGEYAIGKGRRFGESLKQVILRAGTGSLYELELKQVKVRALSKMGLGTDTQMLYGSERYDEYWGLVEAGAEDVARPEGERVTDLEMTQVVMIRVADRLIETVEAGDPAIADSRLVGSYGMGDGKYDKLPDGEKARVRGVKRAFEMTQAETIGRLALRDGSVAALPVLLATGILNNDEVVEEISVVLGNLDEDRRGIWLTLLGRCAEIVRDGGQIQLEGSSAVVAVNIEAGGLVKLEKRPIGDHLAYTSSDFTTDVAVVRSILDEPGKTAVGSVFKNNRSW